TQYTDLTGTGNLLGRYYGLRDEGGSGSTFDYDATFKRTFTPRKHELSVEARFNRDRDQDATTAWRHDAVASPTTQPATPAVAPALTLGEIDASVAVTKQLTLQTDYTRPLGNTKLETGVKSNTRWLDRDYAVQTDSLGNGSWAPSALSNAIRFDETVTAAYGLLSGKHGRAELQGGVRGELATRDFSLTGSGVRVPYRYASLFPSANALYNLSGADQLKLSYSRRIRRPGTQELNPFPVFFGAQNVFLGNPALDPEYTDAVELGYSRTGALGMLQINPFLRHTINAIRFVVNPTDTVAGRELTSITFRNVAAMNTWGTDLLGSVHMGSRLSGFIGANVFRMVTDAGSQTSAAASGTTWSARANMTAEVLPTVTLQGSYFYRAPMNFAGGRFLSMQMTTLTLKKKVDGDNAAITVRVSDPFSTGRFGAYGLNGSVQQLTERSFGMRAAYVGFQYNYGRPPKIRQPDQGSQQQNAPGFP
ncbi:MAG TPA: outer membrane beta-barrel family protein, partial [Candidatus Elarobacter sp.]|nr:outer membrane beta-barrel family protein [Candidatus Elarobacter sp.]